VVVAACWVLGAAGAAAGPGADDQRADTLRRHGLDPSTPIAARVGETPASVLEMFKELGGPPPTPHVLTAEERAKVEAAFEALPPLIRRVLHERLRSLSFLDGMPNTALTSPANPGEPYQLFDITIRAPILGEDVSQWLTWKERTCFEAEGSPLSVSIEAGTADAILYILLHEGTHVVDACLRPGDPDVPGPPFGGFADGVWADRLTLADPYRDPLLESVRYRRTGRVLPIDRARPAYEALARTPFASLYGSSNWYDDLAEFVALYHLTQVLNHPYRLVVLDQGRAVFSHQPMTSDLARSRFDLLSPFYAADAEAMPR
jgi:hypothetical protein